MTVPVNRYGSLAARVYHLDKPIGRSFGDIEYYRERLAGVAGPILEPACGNGRFLIPMLEAGLDIQGFDPSPEMLALCEAECARRGLTAPLARQGFLDFAYDIRFVAIVVPAGSFQLVADAAAARSLLRRFHEALAPGGRLILDLDPLADLEDAASRRLSWESAGDRLTLELTRLETDREARRAVSRLCYALWRDGREAAAEEELFTLRYWDVAEFSAALREAGFEGITASADYRYGAAPGWDTRAITVEATRPAG